MGYKLVLDDHAARTHPTPEKRTACGPGSGPARVTVTFGLGALLLSCHGLAVLFHGAALLVRAAQRGRDPTYVNASQLRRTPRRDGIGDTVSMASTRRNGQLGALPGRSVVATDPSPKASRAAGWAARHGAVRQSRHADLLRGRRPQIAVGSRYRPSVAPTSRSSTRATWPTPCGAGLPSWPADRDTLLASRRALGQLAFASSLTGVSRAALAIAGGS